jgi:tetratricopeptide (TPR) repeat protein
MKKSIFLAALVLISAGCFAQKNMVNQARNLAGAETPDFPGARTAIKAALENEETKDIANTWYVAGFIGYKEYEAEKFKTYMGQQCNVELASNAILESIDYWNKAYELAQIPTIDKKGKEKFDTKTPKSISPKIKDYFESQMLLVAADNAAKSEKFAEAYKFALAHINIPELKVMQNEGLVCDTLYYAFVCQTGLYAEAAGLKDEAIALLKRLDNEKAQNTAKREVLILANKYIYQLLMEKNDTTAAIASLESSIQRFPDEEWFMQNMINLYINGGQEEKAIEYLDLAIQRDPEAGQYYNSKGSILALIGRYDEAFAAFAKALELEPNNANFYSTFGGAYINKGNKLNEDATYLDNAAYQAAKVNIDAAYTEAMKCFEKAYELDPENYDVKRDLRSLYYRLGMNDKYEALKD